MNLTKTGKTKITIKNFDPGRVYDTLRKRRKLFWGQATAEELITFGVRKESIQDYTDGYNQGVYDALKEVSKQA